MKQTLKELTIEYLKSLPVDFLFKTSKNDWTRDKLLAEVESETHIGKEIIEINKKFLLAK